MQFTILSHAGLLIEHRGVKVVCDPWLVGSCYWRSWWNCPEPPAELIEKLEQDYVYLTHLHWDHFHGASLRKLFPRNTRIIIPKVTTLRMVNDLELLGFRDVTEVAHGHSVHLGDDFSLRSYQFGVGVDSGLVFSGGGYNLFNCNDAKFFGGPLRQILRDFPKIDFIFRSHSSASPLPFCVEGYQTLLDYKAPAYDSADQFIRCSLYTGARYAIPFASNHCFLHKDTIQFNETATTPEDVRRRYAAIAVESGQQSECVVMPPGSSWSDSDGFSIVPFDFAAREHYIAELRAKYADKFEQTYREEERATGQFEPFKAYFEDLLNVLPALVRRRMSPVVFQTKDPNGEHNWLVDPAAIRVAEMPTAPDAYVIIRMHPRVLADCVQKRMFSVWGPSKRLKVHLPTAAHLSAASLWFTTLDLYELEIFPLWRNFSLRSLAIRLRRWREPVEVLMLLFRRYALGRRFDVSEIYRRKVEIPKARV